jgi:hypothetical protein
VCRSSNNSELNNYYKKYCKILSGVIKEAERLKYDNNIKNSNNKNKTMWDIVKSETNKGTNNKKICTLNVDGKWVKEKQMIAETFNNYFFSVAENNNAKNKHNNVNISHIPATIHSQYLSQTFTNPFPNIKIKSLSTKEVVNIIKSLKSKYSHGYAEISTKVLRMNSPFINSHTQQIIKTRDFSRTSKIFSDKTTV